MTTISSNSIPGAEAVSPRRTSIDGKSESHLGKPRAAAADTATVGQLTADKSVPGAQAGSAPRVTISAQGGSYLGKPRAMTAEEKAEVGRITANSAATIAASDKQLAEAKTSNSVEGMENHDINLPNISTLSLDDAKAALDLTRMMAESDHYKSLNVRGHDGDQQISDLGTYKAALSAYINQHETALPNAGGGAAVSSQASTTAASAYRQMQVLIDKEGTQG